MANKIMSKKEIEAEIWRRLNEEMPAKRGWRHQDKDVMPVMPDGTPLPADRGADAGWDNSADMFEHNPKLRGYQDTIDKLREEAQTQRDTFKKRDELYNRIERELEIDESVIEARKPKRPRMDTTKTMPGRKQRKRGPSITSKKDDKKLRPAGDEDAARRHERRG